MCKVFQHLLAANTSIGCGWIASGGCSLCFEFDRNRRQHQRPHFLCQHDGNDPYSTLSGRSKLSRHFSSLVKPKLRDKHVSLQWNGWLCINMVTVAISHLPLDDSIVIYRKFPVLANRLGGENAVKVLATLLLLSYTKLQQAVVTIMSFTWLDYPVDGHYVWLYDANLEFFKGKHLYLGIAGILVLVFIIVPYTLCLAFFQQLQACSGHRLFQWVNKLKPLFDSYAGPYKDKYRFWTGMLLVARTLLMLLFATNISGSIDFYLLVLSVVSCAILVAQSNGIYKKWPYNYLETFFYVQLVVFGVCAVYARHNNQSITTVAYTSIALTVVAFLRLSCLLLCCCLQELL